MKAQYIGGNVSRRRPKHLANRATGWALHVLIAACAASMSSAAIAGFESCLEFFPERAIPELPAGFPLKTRELCFSEFAVLYSGDSKTPIYTVERLNKERLARATKRAGKFYEEARLPITERSTLADYKATYDGWRMDRGHVVSAANQSSPQAMVQSFSLANVVPQVQSFNQGAWNRVERDTRKYVKRADGDVFVITGPVFGQRPRHIGPGKVWVPDYMFKLVYDPSAKRAWAHWLPNDADVQVQSPISYDELFKRTGIRFLTDP
ncbi:DNA/RNA non-specific endonuclease [Acidovorax sp.]|uniref:DNA/RNA non-specific endonuclease n=1 Tax=Acidovorax sp. TaxID=1872122 RepID=UPI004037A588